MKNQFFLLSLCLALFGASSCSKDDDNDNDINIPACETNNVGTLRVDSNKEDPYKVYVNSAYKGTVGAYATADFGNIAAGTYSTRYEQASGYILYPTEYTLSVTITQCQTFTATLN